MLDLSAYISVPQAARELSVHQETVRRLLRQGVLPGCKVGTLWLIARQDLLAFKATYNPHAKAKGETGEEMDSPLGRIR